MPSFLLEISRSKTSSKFKFDVNLKGKFKNDQCHFENDQFIVFLDGIILNKKDFIQSSPKAWGLTIVDLFLKKGDSFYKDFRGSFCGVLLDKEKDKWIVFQDHIGSKNIYYSEMTGGSVAFASSISKIYDLRRAKGIREQLDLDAAYMLLSYGYMLEDYTLSTDIRKMLPGCYIKLNHNKISQHKYYEINNVPNNDLTVDEIIDRMDLLFKKAIKRQFDKDLEYGFKHFVALSGGLDSRMTSWVAHKMGYTNQLNFTFSQSEYLDETIPKHIASDLKHEWIFKALDNGLFLKDIEKCTKITGGNIIYNGLAHGLSLYNQLNFEHLGISHSGQLGDVIFGSYNKGIVLQSYFKNGDGAYSRNLINKIDFKSIIKGSYMNYELFCMYQRGLNGVNDGLMGVQQYTETMSPFYDIDVLDFAMTIPMKYRNNQKIYKQWILRKYPEAANYIWEKTGEKINTPSIDIKNTEITPHKLMRKILLKIGVIKLGYNSKNNMNPIEYWINTNEDLRQYLNDYFCANINRIENIQLKEDCISHYKNGNGIEKMQVISLLSALKLFFI